MNQTLNTIEDNKPRYFKEVTIEQLVTNNKTSNNDHEQHFGLPTFDLAYYNPAWLTTIPFELIERYRIIPLSLIDDTLQIGVTDPKELHALNIIMFHTGYKTLPVLVAKEKLEDLIHWIKSNKPQDKLIEANLLNEIDLENKSITTLEDNLHKEEPLIQFVDQMIQTAVTQFASDIHIEPYANTCRIRYRIDGILYETHVLPANIIDRLATRLKVMAKLDITERRLPQDGRFLLDNIDTRISICPTQYGEKIVLRLLNTQSRLLNIDQLGFNMQQKQLFIEKITRPQGLILVTGPTGSGKSATLYAALNHLNHPEKNISTIEDPIEITLPGINQININPKIHFNFSCVLRTLLRQDPDVIMVGEIRDEETARITLQAAETGHLVLSTLHTNNTLDAIQRLTSMGISSYDLLNTITLIISQRLIRVLCPYCKQPDKDISTKATRRYSDLITSAFCAQGCERCLNGYIGRTGIYEFLPIDTQLATVILSGKSRDFIQQQAALTGYTPLINAAITNVNDGTTSLADISRVL